MDEDEYEGYFEDDTPIFARRVNKADFAVLVHDLAHGITSALANTLFKAEQIAAGHSNFQINQDDFHQEAAREIETLISGEESDG